MRPNEYKLRQQEIYNNSLTDIQKSEIKKLLKAGVSKKIIKTVFSVPYQQIKDIKNEK